jgi:hypothetical protein
MAAAGVSTAGAVDFTVAAFTPWLGPTGVDLAGSTAVGFTGIDFTMAGSTTVDFTITGFSSVGRSDIPGGVITRTMGTTITASPTPRRLGIIVPILAATILM